LTQSPEWKEIYVSSDHNETVTLGETDFFFIFSLDQQLNGVGLRVEGHPEWVTFMEQGFRKV
jgi:hypothetical protein